MQKLAKQATEGQYNSKSHSMEFNFNQSEVVQDGLEFHEKMSACGDESKKNAVNLKSRVLGAKAGNENFYFSLSIGIRKEITDDNDLCAKFTKLLASENMKMGNDFSMNLKFNNGRLFVRGAMCMPQEGQTAEMLKIISMIFGKQTSPESFEAGFKLGFSLADFFAPKAECIPAFIMKGMTTKTTICMWEGFFDAALIGMQTTMLANDMPEDQQRGMLMKLSTMIFPFYTSEFQGKVDVDLDPEDVAKLTKLPMAQMMNINADTMLSTMTPFGTNDDTEMI